MPELRFPCSLAEKTMVRQTVPCSLLEDYSGEDLPPAGCGQLHTGAGRCTLKGAVGCGERILEEAGGRNCSPWREAHRGTGFLAGLQLMGDLDWSEQSILEELIFVGRICAGAGKN